MQTVGRLARPARGPRSALPRVGRRVVVLSFCCGAVLLTWVCARTRRGPGEKEARHAPTLRESVVPGRRYVVIFRARPPEGGLAPGTRAWERGPSCAGAQTVARWAG